MGPQYRVVDVWGGQSALYVDNGRTRFIGRKEKKLQQWIMEDDHSHRSVFASMNMQLVHACQNNVG